MNKVIEIALKEVGYEEMPKNSNKTKYGAWFKLNSCPWCGVFVSWVYDQANQRLPNIGFVKGFAGCQTAVAYFKRNDKITKTPSEGDIVFFDWNKDGRYDHTGLFVKWIDEKKGIFETIEGNTAIGNDSNGGEVMVRRRNKSFATFVKV